MMRKLLAATALATLAAGSAYAAETVVDPAAPKTMARFVTSIADVVPASELIGETVYGSTAPNAEVIGEIDELYVDAKGDMQLAVIGVGGFLGVGEKDVAVNFEDLKWAVDQDGDRYAVLETTKEELTGAPEFKYVAAVPAAKTEVVAEIDATTKAPPLPEPAATETTTIETKTKTVEVDRTKLQTVEPGSISAEALIGTTVYGANGESVGEVGDVILSKDGKMDAVVIDVGGFLGIGEKPVAVAFEDLQFMRAEDGTLYLYTKFTEAQFEAAQAYVANEYDARRETMRLRWRG